MLYAYRIGGFFILLFVIAGESMVFAVNLNFYGLFCLQIATNVTLYIVRLLSWLYYSNMEVCVPNVITAWKYTFQTYLSHGSMCFQPSYLPHGSMCFQPSYLPHGSMCFQPRYLPHGSMCFQPSYLPHGSMCFQPSYLPHGSMCFQPSYRII